MRRTLLAAILAPALLSIGCASKSGYSLDIRNNTGEFVRLDMVAKENKNPPEIQTSRIAPAASYTMYTSAGRKADVTLEARVEGDQASDPARMPVTLGRTEVDIFPADPKQAKDAKAPKLKLRTR